MPLALSPAISSSFALGALPHRRMLWRAFWIALMVRLLCSATVLAQEEVYHLTSKEDFESYITRHQGSLSGSPWVLALAPETGGAPGLQVTLPPTVSAAAYVNYLATNPGLLKGGEQYTATLKFSVVTPTTYPNNFYMFARNSAGQQYDIWQGWIGLPGVERTVSLPLDLRDLGEDGKWTFNLGMHGPGSLIIHGFTITQGSQNVTIPPVLNGTASSTLPAGVSVATGATPFAITPPSPEAPVTISLADPKYHFVADAPAGASAIAVANAAGLQLALKDCLAQQGATPHGTTLVVPPGTYRLEPSASIKMEGLRDFTIDGQNAVFVLEKVTSDGQAFVIGNCARMRIKNLAFDWDATVKPISSLGVVSKLSEDRKQCDFTFPDLSPAETSLVLATPWSGLSPIEPARLVRSNIGGFKPPKGTVLSSGGAANVLHATFPSPAPLTNDQAYCVRHMYYDMAAFKIVDATNLVFSGVKIYSFPGMIWLIESDSANLEISDCAIERKAGARNPLTAAADGIHINESQGNVLIKNCTFTGLGDDVINIHDTCYQGEIVRDPADPTKLTLLNCPSYQLRLKAGDKVEFYHADYSPLAPERVLLEVASTTSANNAKPPTTSIKFTSPLSTGLTPQSILRNTRFNTTNVMITDCNFVYTNGRGILLSAENSTLSNCRFDHVFGTILQFETEIVQGLWSEGHGASNVLVKGNKFENSSQLGRYNGAVVYAGPLIPWGQTATPLFQRLTVENNEFVNCPGPAMWFNSSANIVARGNKIIRSQDSANTNRYSGSIFLTNSSNAALGGNTWVNTVPSTFANGVVFDPSTTSALETTGNAVSNK